MLCRTVARNLLMRVTLPNNVSKLAPHATIGWTYQQRTHNFNTNGYKFRNDKWSLLNISNWRNIQRTRQPVAQWLVHQLPKTLVPYAVLMRLDKPTGTCLLLWPAWWSIALATPAACLPSFSTLFLFGIGAVLLRSSGCIINDLWDRNFDSKVERTKTRPLAAGQVTTTEAIALMHCLNAAGLLVILQFDLNSILLALSSMTLVCSYPVFKRFTYYPQLILGMAFNWGALLGWSVMCQGRLDLAAVLPLYIGGICWTLIYDTIYAHQDKKDDLAIGLKSTAIKFGERTVTYLNAFTCLMTASLVLSGLNTDQCWPYYMAVALTTAKLTHNINSVQLDNPESCAKAFNQNNHVGWILFAGIILSTLLKKSTDHKECEKDKEETNVSTVSAPEFHAPKVARNCLF